MANKFENDIPGEDISSAVKMWVDYLQPNLSKGITQDEIEQLMVSASRDKAWIYYGGSGRRSRLYMIDDYVQARFDFDDRDVLISYSVYPRPGGWLKGPGGVLLRGSETPEAELLFP